MKASPGLLLAAGLTLAAISGGLGASFAFGTSSADPTRTVTIDVSSGPQGETGPPGPPGPPGPKGDPGTGALDCPAAYTLGEAVFIQQGKGPTTLLTCIKD